MQGTTVKKKKNPYISGVKKALIWKYYWWYNFKSVCVNKIRVVCTQYQVFSMERKK
jgi:hypothetical protein